MSYSVPRDQLLLGKWIGGYLALITPFMLAFLVGLLIIYLFSQVEAGLDEVLAILALLGVAMLYLGAVYSLGMLVSCRSQTPATSITVLLLIWVAFVLLLPNAAPYVTRGFLPVPTRESVNRETEALTGESRRASRDMIEAEQQRTGSQEVWNDRRFRQKLEVLQGETSARIQKIEDDFRTRMQDQTHWSELLARFSPLSSFHLAAQDIAAAGIDQEIEFVGALRSYGRTWDEYSSQKREAWQQLRERSRSEGGSATNEIEQPDAVDFSDFPRFSFQYMDFKARLDQVYLDVLLLVIWNILFFMLAYTSFVRYDIR